jgi:hypothetical protein
VQGFPDKRIKFPAPAQLFPCSATSGISSVSLWSVLFEVLTAVLTGCALVRQRPARQRSPGSGFDAMTIPWRHPFAGISRSRRRAGFILVIAGPRELKAIAISEQKRSRTVAALRRE